MGLKPAGDDGTFFQRVPFRQAIFKPEQSSVAITVDGSEQPLRNEDDYLTNGDFLLTDATAEGKVVFVGFGITAPELKHDDYKGVDVKARSSPSSQARPPSGSRPSAPTTPRHI